MRHKVGRGEHQVMSDRTTFLKVKFVGGYWKIAWVMNLARLLRLEAVYYSGGTGNGEQY
jgi:hypothetical protein